MLLHHFKSLIVIISLYEHQIGNDKGWGTRSTLSTIGHFKKAIKQIPVNENTTCISTSINKVIRDTEAGDDIGFNAIGKIDLQVHKLLTIK